MEHILEAGKAIYGRSTRPFGIARVHLDDDGTARDVTIEYLNAAMAATVNAEPAELEGKNIYEIWPDGDRTWLDYYYRAAYCDEAVEFETVNVEYRTFQNVAIFPIAEGYCGYELQEVTNWLEQSHPAMENVSAGIFFYESRTDQLLLTEPARECCGLDTDYLTVREFADALFPRETAQRVYDAIEDFSGQHEGVVCEEQLRNGSWIRLSMSHAGPQTRFATGFVEDITFFKEAEAKSARRSEIIESLSSEYYALYLVDYQEDSIMPYLLRNEVAEFFAKCIDVDASYSRWLEDYCASYVVEADRDKVLALLGLPSIRQRFSHEQRDFAVVCKRLFGDEDQYIELRMIKLSGKAHEAVLAARNINDEVTKQIGQNEALQSALTLAKHASEAKTTFLTNISHDFRTPLNSIMGYSNLALAHLGEDDRVRSSLEKIVVSSEHLLDLINEVLDVSRIESGKAVLNEQQADIRHLVADVRDVFSAQAEERGVSFIVYMDQIKHPQVICDHMRINQILVNTVGNAMKYTDHGGHVRLIVSEGAVSSNGVAMFEFVVRDDGCGMSEDFVQRIFMPFERDVSGGAHIAEGTGLGMTITKNLVDLIGGSISVKSAPGEGSEFTIMLPLRLDEAKGSQAAEDEVEVKEHVRFDGYRILVVDDDELSREMVSEVLADRGFEVEQATDGDEAVECVQTSDAGWFDAIIMDMRMPRMAGDVAARTIRDLPREDVRALPIIAATADAFEEGHRRAREAGMTAHITKPLNTKKLMAILHDCLQPA